MKVALITDLHLGYKENTIQSKMMYDTLDWFFDYIQKQNIKNIFVLGDIFNSRTNIDFMTIKNTYDHFINPIIQNNINAYIIAGNHDCYYKNTNEIYSVELLFSHIQNLRLIKNNSETIICGNSTFHLVPWLSPDNYETCMENIKNSTDDYLLGHFEINGFTMVKGIKCQNGISSEIFKKFKKVFSGHFHLNDDQNNICYIGTPYEKDWNDRGEKKGFYILDLDNNQYEHVLNPNNFHIVVEYNNGFDIPIETLKDKNVKVIVNNIDKQSKFDKDILELQKNNPYKTTIIENTQTLIVENKNEENSIEEVQFDLNDNIKLLTLYTDKIETDLNRKKLNDTLIEIYNESISND